MKEELKFSIYDFSAFSDSRWKQQVNLIVQYHVICKTSLWLHSHTTALYFQGFLTNFLSMASLESFGKTIFLLTLVLGLNAGRAL